MILSAYRDFNSSGLWPGIFLFPAFTVGLASFIAVLEDLRLVTRREIYARASDFWIKTFAVSLGMVLPFQFGTNWSRFSDAASNLISPLRASGSRSVSGRLLVPHKFTLWQPAPSASTQAFLLLGTLFLLVMILMYTGWSYWVVFRGKVRADIGYHE